MPNPLETFQFSFQSLIYFFIQQVFLVYAQVSSMILGPGHKMGVDWGRGVYTGQDKGKKGSDLMGPCWPWIARSLDFILKAIEK